MAMSKFDTSTEELKNLVAEERQYVIDLRHKLHKYPEYKWEETETSKLIQGELNKIKKFSGLTYTLDLKKGKNIAILGFLPPKVNGKEITADGVACIALRADMDGLKIIEDTGLPFASKHENHQHACGHDGNMAMLIGALRVLARLQSRPCAIKIFFQPAEEGGAGGKAMVESGVLDNVLHVFGLHAWPSVPLGHVAVCPGFCMAAASFFTMTVKGKGGHGAMPHLCHDPIVATAQIVTALQSIVSRFVPPSETAVVSIGKIVGGDVENQIPETVTLTGTTRTFSTKLLSSIHERMECIATSIAEGMNCTAQVKFADEPYPPAYNDPATTHVVEGIIKDAFGAELCDEFEPTMGAEDFAFYQEKVPSVFAFIGQCPMGEDPKKRPGLHTPKFNFNDDALETGMLLLCKLGLHDWAKEDTAGKQAV